MSRIRKIRKGLDTLAYASVGLDFLVGIVTLASLKYYSNVSGILMYLDYALAAEIAIAGVLFVTLLSLSHYERVLDGFSYAGFVIRNGPMRRRRMARLPANV